MSEPGLAAAADRFSDSPWLGQPIVEVLQINAPGPGAFAEMAIDAWQPADPITAQIHDQPVMVQAHRDLAANQRRRHRVDTGKTR